MRKFVTATIALAFVASTAFPAAFAQDKSGSTPAATSGDTMSKDTMKKAPKKSKKSAKKTGDDTMTKQ
jgi:pentapeptide MXKDX repeat protein